MLTCSLSPPQPEGAALTAKAPRPTSKSTFILDSRQSSEQCSIVLKCKYVLIREAQTLSHGLIVHNYKIKTRNMI